MNDKIDTLIRKYSSRLTHRDRVNFYNELIASCQYSWNPRKNFDQKQSWLSLIANISQLFLFTMTILILFAKDNTIIIKLFIIQIILSVAVILLNKACRNRNLIITKEDKVYQLFDKIYSENLVKWTEFESFITTKYSIEAVGNTLQSKYIPYVATSLSLSAIIKLIPLASNKYTIYGLDISVEMIIAGIIVLSGIFFFIKIVNFRKIDRLEFILKAMASFVNSK